MATWCRQRSRASSSAACVRWVECWSLLCPFPSSSQTSRASTSRVSVARNAKLRRWEKFPLNTQRIWLFWSSRLAICFLYAFTPWRRPISVILRDELLINGRPTVFSVCMRCVICTFITALHWMQGGLVPRKLSVRLFARPSVCRTGALWQNGRKICPHFYTIRKII